ncbi:SEC7 and coiled-coil domain-containing protein 1 [Triplophysa tibetana]|uniref:SEC7 and coiled-coil domain-containing protein 1 n=1 Tax=Triplophysa tibetana TaxID=1572043 RepID=A0A5A9NYQ6_9TELE|nr:SEC7 and coiled-coil domain-containing protein 1 [Triplophysa tibetana]
MSTLAASGTCGKLSGDSSLGEECEGEEKFRSCWKDSQDSDGRRDSEVVMRKRFTSGVKVFRAGQLIEELTHTNMKKSLHQLKTLNTQRHKHSISESDSARMTECQTDFAVEEKMELERLKMHKETLLEDIEGVKYLVENELLDWKAEPVAEFLYKEEGLNKTAIGEEEMNLQILKAFVDLHEFSHLNLVQALRQFLWSFRLPGEAQKIDRMMEAFATRYCNCIPGVFQSTDTCYILSFAIIMLNTSLHNPNVKEKTTLERFISMNRGINNGSDLPDDLLTVSSQSESDLAGL